MHDFAKFIKYSKKNKLVKSDERKKTKIKIIDAHCLSSTELTSFQQTISFGAFVKIPLHKVTCEPYWRVFAIVWYKKPVPSVDIAKSLWCIDTSRSCSSIITFINFSSMFIQGWSTNSSF